MVPWRGELDPVSKTIEKISTVTQGKTFKRVLLESRKKSAKEGTNRDAISQNGKNQAGMVPLKKSVQYPVPTNA